jgi:hypothetical protein
VAIAMRTWAALAEDSLDDAEAPEPSSRLHLSTLLEGRWRLDGDLEALDGEIIATALRLATGCDDEAEAPRTPSERRAEALVDICRSFLEGREHPTSSRHRPHVNVIVTAVDRFPGCDRPARWLDAHHVIHVDDDGPTKMPNLCLLCRRHHRRPHRPGWSAVLKADAELVVTDPNGRVFTSAPPGQHPRPPPEMFAA